MEPLLFLCHRIPYPPHKGDKIHTYHTLRYLARYYRVYLGTFIDDPADRVHIPTVREWCADAWFGDVRPIARRLWSLHGLATGDALSIAYYRDRGLRGWIDRVCVSEKIERALVYSSSMAPFAIGRDGLKVVLDVADLDSRKWSQYATERRGIMAAVYRREGRTLLDYERAAVRRSFASLFATVAEAELLLEHEPTLAPKLFGIPNGVDTDFFEPNVDRASPFRADEAPIVFTGAMNYWPNVDAVVWFADELMPEIRRRRPDVRFYVVGMNPAPEVKALAERHAYVTVTGKVDDVRPYLQHARVFVAPLRIARGIQNKVLEAMAMQCASIVSSGTLTGVRATPGTDLEAAATGAEFVARTLDLLEPSRARAIGRSARARVLRDYNWETLLDGYRAIIEAPTVDAVDLDQARPSAARCRPVAVASNSQYAV